MPVRTLRTPRSRRPRPTNAWTPDELSRIDGAQALQVATYRRDGTLHPYRTIWAVRVGTHVVIRSAGARSNTWFRHARFARTGRVRVGEVEHDVTFDVPPAGTRLAIDAAYHEKYDRFGESTVRHLVGPVVVDVTLHLSPRPAAAS